MGVDCVLFVVALAMEPRGYCYYKKDEKRRTMDRSYLSSHLLVEPPLCASCYVFCLKRALAHGFHDESFCQYSTSHRCLFWCSTYVDTAGALG